MDKIYVSARADNRLVDYLKNMGFQIEIIHTEGLVSAPVSDHPDMFMCRMGPGPGAPVVSHLDNVTDCSSTDVDAYDAGAAILSPGYPDEVAFNAACTGKYFIHNLKYTAPQLLNIAHTMGMIPVDVKQGYAKCSTVIVDEDSIITYDRGLGHRCMDAGINVLFVVPGHVLLKGYECGFLGGASGRIGDTVYFNGDLSAHPDFQAITGFIEERGLRVKWFPEWPLTDIGTIL